MRYKRNEAFRYQLNDSLDAIFTLKVEEDTLSSKGHALIYNISPNGLRFRTEYNLPVDDSRLLLQLQFILNGNEIIMPGHITWKKKIGSLFEYGFEGTEDNDAKQKIINGLKELSRMDNKDTL
ncbi:MULTISPECIES: PilZ domain-containing protein [Bacillaceae]|uniref:PilZ domain-containing protein n=1 Tax=Bacillaceae TaxID=186817 RepID=UPI0004E1C34C|nr:MULTISPECIES: PilZ domain-containing protein [Bacillaceae]MCF2647650.1 PilZ domain-containing protein [Niallia circulans]REB73288.1 PilZ domain-containing protein [Cutibacterium acnes]